MRPAMTGLVGGILLTSGFLVVSRTHEAEPSAVPAGRPIPFAGWTRPSPAFLDSTRRVILQRRLLMPGETGLLPPRGPGSGVPPIVRPILRLHGIVSGAVPLAVIEGLPGGVRHQVVRQGDSSGGIHITRITAHRVVLVGLDTTWILMPPERRTP